MSSTVLTYSYFDNMASWWECLMGRESKSFARALRSAERKRVKVEDLQRTVLLSMYGSGSYQHLTRTISTSSEHYGRSHHGATVIAHELGHSEHFDEEDDVWNQICHVEMPVLKTVYTRDLYKIEEIAWERARGIVEREKWDIDMSVFFAVKSDALRGYHGLIRPGAPPLGAGIPELARSK